MIYGFFSPAGVLDKIESGSDIPNGAELLPQNFCGHPGQHRNEFTADWGVKPLSQKVADGVVVIPKGYILDGENIREKQLSELIRNGEFQIDERHKLVGEQLVEKTKVELIQEGIEKCPPGQKLVQDACGNWEVIAKSIQEQMADGDISDSEAQSIMASLIRQERDAKLAESDWTQLRDVPLLKLKKDQYAVYRKQLRDIPLQSGFPFDVKWPEPPSELAQV